MSEETQNTPIEVNSEATTSQVENNHVVDWNRMRTTDLRAMCSKCGLQVDGSKTELVGRLEAFWNDPEEEPVKPDARKGKSVDHEFGKKYDERDRSPPSEELGYNDAFFSYMENKVEEKIEEKLSNSLSRVLDRGLQQWTARLKGANTIESSFPKKKFRRIRDQYEYDSICDAGIMLQGAIQEDSREKVEEVQERLRLRVFILRVVEEEGWNMVAKIPKPNEEGDEFKELLDEARKKAMQRDGFASSYYRRPWQFKGRRFWSWGAGGNYYTPYPHPQQYMQQSQLLMNQFQNQSIFSNTGPTYQNAFNKNLNKQFTCYYCGGAGHTASVCASRSAEEGVEKNKNVSKYGTKQRCCWEDPRASCSKILDGENKSATSSSMLVKESSAFISKKCMEFSRERDSKTLQVDSRSNEMAKGGN
ncbi:12113_t:CDS:2 [Racocetra persica]|uniref:12113_t:CDS:1 n=1 Tax=Racocetra persica TaxID=160502 RepID=A0ACA9LL35_9GLOM|nr:12113_t:CDS:2 [Racocetra persica]